MDTKLSIQKQFTVFLINKPGKLAHVCAELAHRKVNIVALTVMDTTDHGLLRMVVEQPDEARTVLTGLNVEITETDVLVVEMSNKPGAMAHVAERLGKEHINIKYMYVSSGTAGGHTLGVFSVNDIKKAEKVLATENNEKHRELPKKLRRVASRKGG